VALYKDLVKKQLSLYTSACVLAPVSTPTGGRPLSS
jgi:hypothetical protein